MFSRNRPISRRTLLRSAGVSFAGVLYPAVFEPRWLEVTRTRVPIGLRSTVRLLHLTDLHASEVVPYSVIENAISLGLAEKPDVACITGDFITAKTGFDPVRYAKILRVLSLAVPTYATFGNHDGGLWARDRYGHRDHSDVDRILEHAGIEVLHNRSAKLCFRDERLTLAGVGDLWSGEIDAARAYRDAGGGGPVVLLSHNPDSKEMLRPWLWQLMLCGHTHGGQVILPFQGPDFAPVKDKRYVAGLNPWEGRQIYTSRGVGSYAGIRFRCRPEVTVLDLV